MATHSSVLAWRIPGRAEPGGLPSMGSHRVGQDKWLSSSSSSICCCFVAQLCPTLLWSNGCYSFVAHQVPLSMRFPRQEYWSGLSFPSPGDLLDPGTEPTSPALAGKFFTAEPPCIWNNQAYCTCLNILMSTDNRKRTRCHLWPDKSKITRAQNSKWWRQPLHMKCWERWKT